MALACQGKVEEKMMEKRIRKGSWGESGALSE